MASDYRISGNGTTIYLVNSSGQPTAGGAATAAATTPWMIRYADWQPKAAPPGTLFAGGLPVAQSYDVVEETIPLILVGGTPDTLVARLQQLRQVAASWIASTPAQLLAQPSGSSQPVYYEIYKAHVQERAPASSASPGEGASTCWVDLTITRSIFGARLSSGETLLNAQTYTVAGSTVTLPTNQFAYGAGAGDLVSEGSPLNLKITPTTAGSDIGELWVSTIWGYTNGTVNAPLSAYGGTAVTANLSVATLLAHTSAKLRVIGRVSNTTGGAVSKYRIAVRGSASTGLLFPLYLTPAPGVAPTIESTGLVDFGPVALDVLRSLSPLTGNIQIDFYATTSAGTCTLIAVELLVYTDFAKISGLLATQASGDYVWLNSFRAKSGQVCVPTPQAAGTLTSADALKSPARIRGTLPRYLAGASLWANWVDATGNTTTAATRAATITVTHSPQYRTLRGAG